MKLALIKNELEWDSMFNVLNIGKHIPLRDKINLADVKRCSMFHIECGCVSSSYGSIMHPILNQGPRAATSTWAQAYKEVVLCRNE